VIRSAVACFGSFFGALQRLVPRCPARHLRIACTIDGRNRFVGRPSNFPTGLSGFGARLLAGMRPKFRKLV